MAFVQSVVTWFKNEPVIDAALVSAGLTIAGSLAANKGELGVIAGAVQLILAAVARTQTYPANKIKANADLLPAPAPKLPQVFMEDMAHGEVPKNG